MSPGGRSIVGGAGLSALSAVALVLASTSFGVWPLVFVAFVPFVVAQNRVLPVRWSGLGLAIGFGSYLVWILWDTVLPGQRWVFVPLVLGLFAGGWVSRLGWDATGRRHLWADPLVWTAVLFLLGMTRIASWIDPAYSLYHQAWLLQPISLVGTAGLNLLVLLVNYAIAGLVIGRRTRITLVTAGLIGVLAGTWAVGGALMLADFDAGPGVRVAVVQPGIRDLHSPASAEERAAVAVRTQAKLLRATDVAVRLHARVVVWPEEVLRYVDPSRGELPAAVARDRVVLVTGFTEDPGRFNRAVLIDPLTRGQVQTLVYDKQHPITIQGDHSIGGPVRVADTELGRIAPIICYDLDYPQTARDAVRAGAQLLAVPSWDWSGIAKQHYAHLVFRAVENAVPAAKADTAWDSVIVDSDGRIRARHLSTTGDASVSVVTVHLGTGSTFYTRHGDLLGWSAVVIGGLWGAFAAVAIGRRAQRARGGSAGAGEN